MILKSARLLALLIAATALPVMAQNIAVVNGKPIPSSLADMIVKNATTQAAARGQKDVPPDLREKVKEHLIDQQVLSQESERLGLAKEDEVKNEIAYSRQQILANVLVKNYLKNNPVKEEDLKAEYEKFKAQASDKEYHARHILVDNEDDAKAIIVKLKGGAKFEDLAKEKSKDSTASNGGDLDWGNGYVKPFLDALAGLKKGQFTETPVKTQFGYHVIKLEDTRPAKVPTYDEVKANFTQNLQQRAFEQYRQALRAKAKIQ